MQPSSSFHMLIQVLSTELELLPVQITRSSRCDQSLIQEIKHESIQNRISWFNYKGSLHFGSQSSVIKQYEFKTFKDEGVLKANLCFLLWLLLKQLLGNHESTCDGNAERREVRSEKHSLPITLMTPNPPSGSTIGAESSTGPAIYRTPRLMEAALSLIPPRLPTSLQFLFDSLYRNGVSQMVLLEYLMRRQTTTIFEKDGMLLLSPRRSFRKMSQWVLNAIHVRVFFIFWNPILSWLTLEALPRGSSLWSPMQTICIFESVSWDTVASLSIYLSMQGKRESQSISSGNHSEGTSNPSTAVACIAESMISHVSLDLWEKQCMQPHRTKYFVTTIFILKRSSIPAISRLNTFWCWRMTFRDS